METNSDRLDFPHWFSKSETTHDVARGIMQYGPIARTPLAQIFNLSQGALSRITSDLIYDGVIEELPAGVAQSGTLPQGFTAHDTSGRRGRPQTALRIREHEHTFIGVNIHDGAITVSEVNTMCRPIGADLTEDIDDRSPDAIVAQIARMVHTATASDMPAPTAIGLSLGGHIEDDRVVTFAPFLYWDSAVDLGALVQHATGIPTMVFNDLDSTLLYECWFGDAIGIPRFAIITMGAGVGYSLSDHGNPIDNPDKSYGLAGHVLIDPEGPRCSSGHVGCSQCLTSDSIAEEYSGIVGRETTFEEFAHDLEMNRPQARRLGERTCFRLGVLVATVANLAMPSQVLISGESSFIAKKNREFIRKGIDVYRHSQAAPVSFTIPDFSWRLWSDAAAARAIAAFIS
ncbi:ROK family protein [Bifidobacterium choerinum]|uniref:NagC family transcriptional regulator n=1 Tax=Bifidobacterium choerinum TaxID=35760 RepID=A0A087AGN2_9BIFI|nr:ROK family protein [Bifidobacterium choerinum]ATU19938.1 NagC family transcriptional regulator [Bifidobacterium choerinum]KFI57932.1 Xylose repressor [Bifidobacterium choerinum]